MNIILKSAMILAVVAGTSLITKEVKTVNVETSTAVWTGKKFAGSHSGTIDLKSGQLEFNNKQLTGGEFIIDMSSIEVTDLSGGTKAKFEGHLKSDDFFSTATHETATLKITKVDNTSSPYKVSANLTVKGITNPITFDLTTTEDTATTQIVIDRSKYDVKYGSKSFFSGLGDNFIYDNFEVDITLKY
ncbi:polyisoprenoid-binding protein YceI [Nonlabens xylanidelens]|uniref:Polyisoprenoid-binding protein YceI n=1 Tax=Nonlabens xylanidelens TaxID=191564 RepID=A0A2S6IDV1_9FLAO|nr:YceI family protein [Nonlabens xylanidelens]PPK92379.1 polyisoprenoid-binding protein YceI [Nonlabens xylanidelens]PQJ19751.1 lipid-binding protein [Nonlabens xylanidelens]